MTKPQSSRVAGSKQGAISSAKSSRSDTRERLEHDILEGAKRLFAVRGYGGVSLDAIATHSTRLVPQRRCNRVWVSAESTSSSSQPAS